VARVLIRQLDELGCRAALRDDELDAGRQLAQRIEIGRGERQHHPLGALLERQIVAHQERAQHLAFRGVLDMLQEPVLARHEPAVSNAKDHTGRVVAVARQADRIGVTTADDFHRLWLLELVPTISTHRAAAQHARSPGRRSPPASAPAARARTSSVFPERKSSTSSIIRGSPAAL